MWININFWTAEKVAVSSLFVNTFKNHAHDANIKSLSLRTIRKWYTNILCGNHDKFLPSTQRKSSARTSTSLWRNGRKKHSQRISINIQIFLFRSFCCRRHRFFCLRKKHENFYVCMYHRIRNKGETFLFILWWMVVKNNKINNESHRHLTAALLLFSQFTLTTFTAIEWLQRLKSSLRQHQILIPFPSLYSRAHIYGIKM